MVRRGDASRQYTKAGANMDFTQFDQTDHYDRQEAIEQQVREVERKPVKYIVKLVKINNKWVHEIKERVAV